MRRSKSPAAAGVYRRLPAVSVDVAVMQRLTALPDARPRVAVVPARFDWNDVGTWVAVPELWGYDTAGNAALLTSLVPGSKPSHGILLRLSRKPALRCTILTS